MIYNSIEELDAAYGGRETIECFEDELKYIEDAFDTYEALGFQETLQGERYKRLKFTVNGRRNYADQSEYEYEMDITKYPMWSITLENGVKIDDATPEEICKAVNSENINIELDNDYELIELFDKPALFTNARITDADVPKGMYCYHLRHGDEEYFSTIEKRVVVNHSGSVITKEPIDLGEQGYISFTEDTSPNFTGETMSLYQFREYRPEQEQTEAEDIGNGDKVSDDDCLKKTVIEFIDENVDGCGTNISATAVVTGPTVTDETKKSILKAIATAKEEISDWDTDYCLDAAEKWLFDNGYAVEFVIPTVNITF